MSDSQMDSRSIEILELQKIIERLAIECRTSLGVEMARRLSPIVAEADVRGQLADTSEAVAFVATQKGQLFDGIRDIRALLRRAEAGGMLDARDLIQVADTLSGFRRLAVALTTPAAREYGRLLQRAWQITSQEDIEDEINAAIEDPGETPGSIGIGIKDNATDELRRIRRAIRSLTEQIQSRIRNLVSDSSFQKHLQEPIFTQRDGRYVVPVRSEARQQVAGIVHDRSSSGATFFIEPQQLVDLNNELRQHQLEERDEVERILARLSALVGTRRPEIESSLRLVGELDFVFAKAHLSIRMRATCPHLRVDGIVDLKGARHPLLVERLEGADASPVVPIDIYLGESFDVLLITGPNTGGKTVTLKTLGLLTLMTECGLHIPAAPDSQVNLFSSVFADIGDEQSVEQSLSTFSSHMKRIIRFLRRSGSGTLVLLDEIGAGTDPDEGAALAKSVLQAFRHSGAKVAATTHYGELKRFATTEARVENASVEFDPASLRPTYRLRIGIPGSSNAFSIARRLGLSWNLIRRAQRMMRRDQLEASRLIRELERSQQELDKESELAHRTRQDVERLRNEYDRKVTGLPEERSRILEEARHEANTLLRQARDEVGEIMRRLRSQTRESKETETARTELRQLAAVVDEKFRGLTDELEAAETEADSVSLAPGDVVEVASLGRTGILLSASDRDDRVTVQIGQAVVELDAHQVRRSKGELEPDSRSQVTPLRISKSMTVPLELHLRGMILDDAVPVLEKYIDDALLGELPEVRIVHGKGTGVLRRAVHDLLRSHPGVHSFRLADNSQGGDGATVVSLRGGER